MENNMAQANNQAHNNEAQDTPPDLAAKYKNKMKSVETQLEKMSHNAVESVENKATEIAKSFSQYAETGRRFITENPLQSVAIAAAVGLVVGLTLTMGVRRSVRSLI